MRSTQTFFSSGNLVLGDKHILIATITLFFLGLTYASTFPFISIIWVTQLEMSDRYYSMIMLCMGIVGTTTNLCLGYMSDQIRNRKTLILGTLLVGTIGSIIYSLAPSVVTFLIAVVAIRSMSSSTYSLLFGTIRERIAPLGAATAASVNSIVRAIYAISWIVVPGLVGTLIAIYGTYILTFLIASAAFLICFFLYLFCESPIKSTSHKSLRPTAIKNILPSLFGRSIFFRLVALSLINSAHPLIAAISPLLIVNLKNTSIADVGLVAGAVALLEIPFMILAGTALQRWSTSQIIVVGGIIHSAYLLALFFVSDIHQIYAISLLNAFGTSIVLTQHMSLVQDMFRDRPGFGTSMMSVVSLLASLFSGLVFFAGTTLGGYSTVASIGSALTLFGAIWVLVQDRKTLPDEETPTVQSILEN